MFSLPLFSQKLHTGLKLFLPKCLTGFTVKPTGPGIFFVGKFLMTNLIDIKMFWFSISSCVHSGKLCFWRNAWKNLHYSKDPNQIDQTRKCSVSSMSSVLHVTTSYVSSNTNRNHKFSVVFRHNGRKPLFCSLLPKSHVCAPVPSRTYVWVHTLTQSCLLSY